VGHGYLRKEKDMEMTEKELQALVDLAGVKLMEAYEGVDGAEYVMWLNILCKLAAQKAVEYGTV
jgi:hypothetical protein